MNRTLNHKQEIYKEMSYVDYFNVKARGLSRKLENLLQCDNFCAYDIDESNLARREMLQFKNQYPNTHNVLYINIPFCATRCEYCPYFVEKYNKSRVCEYLDALELEIDRIKETPYVKSTEFECLYIGGGTPSILSSNEIKRLLTKVFSSFAFSSDGEFTFESNPATLTDEKILTLKEVGINRVSLGVQTFNDRILKEMDCAHNSNKAKEVIKQLLDIGIIVNTDMMFGFLGQSEDDIITDLTELKYIKNLNQVTYFPLRIIDNTELEKYNYGKEKITIEQHNKKLLNIDKLIETKMIDIGYVREESPIFYFNKNSHKHRYISTAARVLGLGAGGGTLIDHGESKNNSDVGKYISNLKENGYGTKSAAFLTREQSFERHILYSIVYLNRSLGDFKNVINNDFKDYYNISAEDRIEKVISDMKRLKFIYEDDNGKIIITKRMWNVLGQIQIGVPSII